MRSPREQRVWTPCCAVFCLVVKALNCSRGFRFEQEFLLQPLSPFLHKPDLTVCKSELNTRFVKKAKKMASEIVCKSMCLVNALSEVNLTFLCTVQSANCCFRYHFKFKGAKLVCWHMFFHKPVKIYVAWHVKMLIRVHENWNGCFGMSIVKGHPEMFMFCFVMAWSWILFDCKWKFHFLEVLA